MNVESNVSGIVTGTGIATGNIEFWPFNYGTIAVLGGIGGNSSVYDFNDQSANADNYGSMQIHNYGAGQTLLAYNDWGGNPTLPIDDVGIGNNTSSNTFDARVHPDWTFQQNAATYTTKLLEVYVRAATNKPPVADAGPDQTNANAVECTSPSGASVSLDGSGSFDPDNDPLTYTWREGTTVLAGPTTTTSIPIEIVSLSLGNHTIDLEVSDGSATDTDQVLVNVVDTAAPVPDVATLPAVTGECSATISGPPTATDICEGTITGTTTDALTRTTQGTSVVTWTFDDGNGNSTTQTQNIVVNDVTAPVADLASLPDVTGQCSATISGSPTSTDNCAGAITGTTTDALTRSTQGTSVVTWTYDDGNGNTSTQTQNIVVDDTIAPVPDVATLADVTGQCSATISGSPTSTDNCAGAITGTTTDALTRTTQGTSVVTWTFDDGNGNTTTQTQNIVVDDVTAPVPATVPLPDATGECSATISSAPTATDNCAGTITGTTTDALTRTTQGTSVVTWTFDDGNGNTTTQTQSIVVEDITGPAVTVPADLVVECTGPSGQAVSIGIATAIDNCDPSPTVTNDAPGTFFLGTTVVTWTAEDATGNTSTATQNITVEDTTPPEIEAALMRVGGSGDDDDDDGGSGNLFMVSVLGTDVCDPDPVETACIVQPLGPTDQFKLKFKKNKGGGDDDDDDGGGAVKNEIQIKIGKKKTKVTLKGPDQQFLEDLLDAAILKGGFAVIDGQKVKLVVKGGGNDDDDDDGGSGGGTWKFVFDPNGNLISASGPGLTLRAFATDASGNVSDILDVPVPKKGKGKHAKLAKNSTRGGNRLVGGLDPLSGSPDVRFALDSSEPLSFRLDQNFPNPFNPETTIRYAVEEASQVRLTIYNIQGQEVRVVVNAPHSAGRYKTRWDGRDALGRAVSTGVYVYRLEAGTSVALRKMVFVK